MNHPSDSLFNAMRAVVEAPGYPLLRNYQQDFYKYDREILRSTWTQDMSVESQRKLGHFWGGSH